MMKKFVFPTVVAMETRKGHNFSYHSNCCYMEKCFIKHLNLIRTNYHKKIKLIVQALGEKKCHNLKKINFEKRA